MEPSSIAIVVRSPALDRPLEERLEAGEVLLLGRDPDPARLAPDDVPPGLRLRVVKVAGSTVSGNHALVWRAAGRTLVRDLRSRNGTTVAVGAGETAASDAAAVALELAPGPPPGGMARPRDAEWTDEGEFPGAVAAAVSRWLADGDLAAVARAQRRAERPAGRQVGLLPPIPLAGEWVLQIVEQGAPGTVNPLWGHAIETVVGYVHDQRARLRDEQAWAHDGAFVVASPAFREAHRRVAEAAARGLQAILLGETGAGKGTLARCYHLHSPRRAGPFEVVNCAEIDKHFARTRLFGAKKGAYTGCTADVVGAVECAHGGTLFLDELADLPLDVQGELLTFLDDLRYKRLGDDRWREADVALVCGTNGDLRRAVRDGRFRADLWYRLAGRIVEVPPLRERREDVVAFLKGYSLGEAQGALDAWTALTPDARRAALEHPWRGNFRELAGFVRRLPLAARPESIDLAACAEALREGALDVDPATAARAALAPPGGWDEMLTAASRIYRQRSQAAEPARAGEFRDYVEEILKPMFFARALGLEDLEALPERPSPSFEEMARRMGCDASTVKNQLGRYAEIRRTWLALKG